MPPTPPVPPLVRGQVTEFPPGSGNFFQANASLEWVPVPAAQVPIRSAVSRFRQQQEARRAAVEEEEREEVLQTRREERVRRRTPAEEQLEAPGQIPPREREPIGELVITTPEGRQVSQILSDTGMQTRFRRDPLLGPPASAQETATFDPVTEQFRRTAQQERVREAGRREIEDPTFFEELAGGIGEQIFPTPDEPVPLSLTREGRGEIARQAGRGTLEALGGVAALPLAPGRIASLATTPAAQQQLLTARTTTPVQLGVSAALPLAGPPIGLRALARAGGLGRFRETDVLAVGTRTRQALIVPGRPPSALQQLEVGVRRAPATQTFAPGDVARGLVETTRVTRPRPGVTAVQQEAIQPLLGPSRIVRGRRPEAPPFTLRGARVTTGIRTGGPGGVFQGREELGLFIREPTRRAGDDLFRIPVSRTTGTLGGTRPFDFTNLRIQDLQRIGGVPRPPARAPGPGLLTRRGRRARPRPPRERPPRIVERVGEFFSEEELITTRLGVTPTVERVSRRQASLQGSISLGLRELRSQITQGTRDVTFGARGLTIPRITTGVGQRVRQRARPVLAQRPTISTRVRPRSRTATRFGIRGRGTQRFGIPLIFPATEREPKPKKEQFYNAFVKDEPFRSSKFVRVTKKPLTKVRALRRGFTVADNTISQTVELRKAGKPRKVKRRSSGFAAFFEGIGGPASKFRRDGRFVNRFIEKRAFAIDTRGEVAKLKASQFLARESRRRGRRKRKRRR